MNSEVIIVCASNNSGRQNTYLYNELALILLKWLATKVLDISIT